MMTKSVNRQKEILLERWSEADYPGGTERFQLGLFFKDAVVFFVVPITAIVFYKVVETSFTSGTRMPERRRVEMPIGPNDKNSQIINFGGNGGSGSKFGFAKRAPGTLVKVRLLNVVETNGNTPVHAQIVDAALGKEFIGGTLVGEACPEPNSGRISIDFHFVRHPKRVDLAVPLSAHALSLDGTYGIEAMKKEGFFARAAIRSAATNGNAVDTGTNKDDFRTLVARSVAAGLMQEFQSDAQVAHNNAQVLTLKPMTEFYVELTDYFPGQM